MKRFLPAASSILLLAAALSACGGAYTPPSRAIDSDIHASRDSGSATLLHSENFNFRDSEVAR